MAAATKVLMRALWRGGSSSRIMRLDLVVARRPQRLAIYRRAACQQLVEDHTQRVDVATGIHVQQARPAPDSCTAACRGSARSQ